MNDFLMQAGLVAGLFAWIAIFGGIVYAVRTLFRRRHRP